jgi:hypothetical protein
VICKLGYAIPYDKSRLEWPCHVCDETDCEESLRFEGWPDDDDDDGEIGELENEGL